MTVDILIIQIMLEISKTDFLYPYIYVKTNLSGDDLYLLTKPIVYLIVFDRNRTKAKMFYKTYEESRYSLFKRINGKFKIINAGRGLE